MSLPSKVASKVASTGAGVVDRLPPGPYVPQPSIAVQVKARAMKVINSLKSAKKRHKECRVVRRKGRVYVINKRNPRFKARQG